MTVQWQSLTDLILEMGDVKNPSTMEGNFSHSLKQLFNVHTLEIRHLFLGKGRIDAHSVMDICGIHLFSPHNHPKNHPMESNLRKSRCSKDGNLPTLVVFDGDMSTKRLQKKNSMIDLIDFVGRYNFFWKILGHRTIPILKPSGISPIKVRKNDENLSSPFRSASGGVK